MPEAHYRKGIREGRWVRAIEGNRVFDSVSMAARSYGVSPQAIRKAINSGCRAGGVHWEDMKRVDRPKILKPEVPWSVYGKRQKPPRS